MKFIVTHMRNYDIYVESEEMVEDIHGVAHDGIEAAIRQLWGRNWNSAYDWIEINIMDEDTEYKNWLDNAR